MFRNVVIEQALIGAVRGIKERIDRAISASETWRYQLGCTPAYVGDFTVVDVEEPHGDTVILTFHSSPLDTAQYRIHVEFQNIDDEVDAMVIDLDIEDSKIMVSPVIGTSTEEVTQSMVEDDDFFFYPIEDLGSVISAMAHVTAGELLRDEVEAEEQKDKLRQAEREQRKAKFQVFVGNKGN